MRRFWLSSILLIIASFVLTNTSFYRSNIETTIGKAYAGISVHLIRWFGLDASIKSSEIVYKDFNMQVAKGCDAVLPMLILISLIGIFPGISVQGKLKGIGVGILFLALANIIRIVSLFYIGYYAKSWFDFFHVEFWQALFILIGALYFFYWVHRQPVNA